MNDLPSGPVSPRGLGEILQKWLQMKEKAARRILRDLGRPIEEINGSGNSGDRSNRIAHQGGIRPLNILLAEDEEDNRLLVQVY